MRTQADRATDFRTLHEREGIFIIPNPWDVGTARILEGLGFEALATTSAGFAFSLGRRDNAVGRERVIEHVAVLAAATDLPLSVDLENGFGDAPETAAEAIRLSAEAGAAGGSIEDATGRPEDPIYAHDLAVERVRAAAEAARALPFPFTLTGRADNYLHGRPDLADTIRRLQAYQEAGADVLYAPGLRTAEEIAAVVRSVDRPVNVVIGLGGVQLDVATLADLGVKRISTGSALARAALGAFLRAGRELRDRGTFSFTADAIGSAEIGRFFDDREAASPHHR